MPRSYWRFLTYLYLKETKNQRSIAQRSIQLTQKAFEFESRAQPYIKNVQTQWEPDTIKQRLKGRTHITLANCGRSAARNIKFERVLIKGTDRLEQTINLTEYLYPGQEPKLSMSPIHVSCTSEQMLAFKERKKRGAKIWPPPPKDNQDPLRMDLELVYNDTKGEPVNVPYHFEFNYGQNEWVPAGFGFE